MGMYMSVTCGQGTIEAEGGFRQLGAGTAADYEPPKLSAGNQTQLSGKTASPLNCVVMSPAQKNLAK